MNGNYVVYGDTVCIGHGHIPRRSCTIRLMCHPLYTAVVACLNGLEYQLNGCSNHSSGVHYSSFLVNFTESVGVVFPVKGHINFQQKHLSSNGATVSKRRNNLTLTCKGVSKIDKDSAMHSTIWRRTRKWKHFIQIAKKGIFCYNGLKSGS